MASKRALVSYVGPGLRLQAATGSGHALMFDDVEGDDGPRPMEVLLAALGACTAMDVLSLLRKKRQEIGSYRVRLEGEQATEHPHVLTGVRVVHEFEGGSLDPAAVRRSIELSAARYCAISTTLASGITGVSHWYVLRGEAPADDEVGEVLVSGPGRVPAGSAEPVA
ncbi:MAG TPA: OsmC family protein [Candidatus Limnocylindria bacterium]|nr:OsmC family protein [Candidatus Limnocylindria bacterium]